MTSTNDLVDMRFNREELSILVSAMEEYRDNHAGCNHVDFMVVLKLHNGFDHMFTELTREYGEL